jgi:hypothetical protein
VATRSLPELEPRSEASEELASLIEHRAGLDAQLVELDRRQREATAARDRASATLADLERQAAFGQEVTKSEREKAERELMQAKGVHAAPWQERREGLRAAVRDADRALSAFVADHFDKLRAEVEEDADAAAEAVTQAARSLVAAFHERQAVDQRVTSLAAMIGRTMRPGDVLRSRAGEAARAAERLLATGGERPPRLTVDPRRPRHSQAVAEAEPDAAPDAA